MTLEQTVAEPLYINLRLRAEGDRLKELRQIADREFEGNLSMAIRKAIRDYVDNVNAETVPQGEAI